MERELFWFVSLAALIHDTKKLVVATWPAMKKEQWDGVSALGEQSRKMNLKSFAIIVFDLDSVVWE